MSEKIIAHGQLEVYRKALQTAMVIFELSKKFPKEETYSLTDQIRRSSVPFAPTLLKLGASGDMKQPSSTN